MSIFGYNTNGASEDTPWGVNNCIGSIFTFPAVGGATIQIHCWFHSFADNNISMAVYTDNLGSPNARLGSAATAFIASTGGTATELDMNYVRTLSANTPYWIILSADNNIHVHYDVGAANQGVHNYNPATGCADPFDATGIGFGTNQWSMWVDYTPAGGGGNVYTLASSNGAYALTGYNAAPSLSGFTSTMTIGTIR